MFAECVPFRALQACFEGVRVETVMFEIDILVSSVQRLVLGRDSADNCGGSAVASVPCGDSTDAVLGQVDDICCCSMTKAWS